jgi:hypothetical protein
MKIITDCTHGSKFDAIKGIFPFTKGFEIITNEPLDTRTPLSLLDLIDQTKKRLLGLETEAGFLKSLWYATTIQRGFHFTGTLWHMQARVGIITSTKACAIGFTSSVPIPLESSKLKSEDETRNIRDLVKCEYPEWNSEKVSLFTFLTDEDEVMWFQEPLRYCFKEIIRQQKKSLV